MSLAAVHRSAAIRPFLEACRTRRADVALVGDSNTYAATTSGNLVGFQRAWGRRFGQYAGAVKATQTQGGPVLDYGLDFSSQSPARGVPASHAAYAMPANGFDPFYVAGGPDGTTDAEFGFFVGAAAVSGGNNLPSIGIRWHYDVGTFATGAGTYQPVMRAEGGLAYYVVGAQRYTNTGTVGVRREYLDASNVTVARPLLQFAVHPGNGYADGIRPQGPFVSFYQRIEYPSVLTGVAVSHLLYQPSQGTRAAAASLAAMTQTQFDTWAAMVTVAQVGRPTLLINLLQGQNDGADDGGGATTASLGPSPAASNTPEGVADNSAAVVNRFRALWAGAGYDVADLYFLLGPYHPQDETRRVWGRRVDAALSAYADAESNVAVATRSRLSSSAYFRAKGWYGGGPGDDAHLTAGGYAGWAEVAVSAVAPPPAVLVRHDSGAALDLKLFDEAGQVYDAAHGGFGAWDDAAVDDYAIAGAELGTSGVYRFVLPASLARAAVLRGHVTARAGGTPDLADAHVALLEPAAFDGLRAVDPAAADDERRDAGRLLAADGRLLAAHLDAPVSRAGTGAGSVAVDHDTGGADALRFVSGPAGVGGATVRAYVKADYEAGAYVERGRTTTTDDGRWASPLYLSAGVTYTLTFAKPGITQVSRRDVTV